MVEYNLWFPDEGSFDLEIWNQVKENVEQASRQGENIPIVFWPLWALMKIMILLFQGNSRPPPPIFVSKQNDHDTNIN